MPRPRIVHRPSRVVDRRQLDAVTLRVGHDVLVRLQLGKVILGLARQPQGLVGERLVPGAVVGERPFDAGLAVVVSGQRQLPAAELGV